MKHLNPLSVAVVVLMPTFCVSPVPGQDSRGTDSAGTDFMPKIHHENIAGVSLFAADPDIVTPVGIAVAPDGRVFVQENHTHQRTSDYEGPETDRILVFEDTDHDGVADRRSVFYEGHTFSTDLLFGPDGHLYVSTRWFVGRFLNAASRRKADGDPEKIVVCETDGDYPHNGVGGLVIDPARPDWMAFGFGENLGVDYAFVGSDGVKLSGGGEGGSTYRCRTDGTGLTRVSTGHWNAFGMAFDLHGNLFSTDNDPNATPPNRLLHVISGAVFGYEYRYGRSGQHPLVCWHGENPGTLGMIGALGEAACGLVPFGPRQLLSASWTDNRVDLHVLKPKGASFTATRQPFLTGPDDFRPVHFSYSPDGRYLYFTDWVRLSYPVHGHGRIWRVEFREPVSLKSTAGDATRATLTSAQALNDLGSDDPVVRTHAVHFLTANPQALKAYDWQSNTNAVARAHYAVARKRMDVTDHGELIPALLQDSDAGVRFVGIKWAADEKLQQYDAALEQLLERPDLRRRDLRAVVAALARIRTDSKREFQPDDALVDLLLDANKTAAVRAMALQLVNPDHRRLTVEALAQLAQSPIDDIRREAIRSLVLCADQQRTAVLAKLAADSLLHPEMRADAIAGLAADAGNHAELLTELTDDASETVASEARRTLVAGGLRERKVGTRPSATSVKDWIELLDREVSGETSVATGRRLFFHSRFAGCYKCHAMNGRGNSVGPDLTAIRNQSDVTRDWLLEHIINPNAEMAPYYRPQTLVTVDGRVFTGLIVGREGHKQAYVRTDGTIFKVAKDDVEERRELTTSIMPTGLLDQLTYNEIRDLLAYLLAGDDK